MEDGLVESLIAFKKRNDLTVEDTLNCMLLRLIHAIERQNDLKEFELKETLLYKPGLKKGLWD